MGYSIPPSDAAKQAHSLLSDIIANHLAGPTGEFPDGKLNANDQGELHVVVSVDRAKGLVQLHFGTPVAWLGFTPEQAKVIGESLVKVATQLAG